MYKSSKLFVPIICLLMGLCGFLVFITLFFDYTLFLISAGVSLVCFIALLITIKRIDKRGSGILKDIGQGVLYTGETSFIDAPIPVITVYAGNEIIWYNDICGDNVFAGSDMRGYNISDIFPGMDVTATSPAEGYAISYGDRQYTVHISVTQRGNATVSVLYFIDDTDFKHYTEEYHLTRPSVAVIMVDNFDELSRDYKEIERAQLMGEIENLIEKYVADNSGFLVRTNRESYVAVFEERGIKDIIAAKFDILDMVRTISTAERMNPTLSIGVGHMAESMHESEVMARQALDMCLGRGGDQVAIKTQNGYDFYGGISKGIEKRTKVKTRIIAAALNELILSSENVIIMGHRFADLDCLGSSAGMLKAVKSMKKPAVICIDPEKNLVKPLMNRLISSGSYTNEDFVAPEQAIELVKDETLLVVLDTHVPYILESEELYKKCRTVVVIDHHRKLVNHIDNAVIFYHEPFASSASEMVAELLQYFPSKPQIFKADAEALLSGIMLDTKNFILRTGVRTFEAAAYLRRMGADTVEVRKLFASSMESYRKRTALVANAEIYKNCAVAASDIQFDDIKIVAPQSADELMGIEGVDASFVIYKYDNVVNVSARSLGELNVQVIMESLGGGGHLTMAAAQFPDADTADILEKVKQAIDSYYVAISPAEDIDPENIPAESVPPEIASEAIEKSNTDKPE